jgi:hypothetical protein
LTGQEEPLDVYRLDIFVEDPKTEKREPQDIYRPGIYVKDPEVRRGSLLMYIDLASVSRNPRLSMPVQRRPHLGASSEDPETLKAQSEKILITPLS